MLDLLLSFNTSVTTKALYVKILSHPSVPWASLVSYGVKFSDAHNLETLGEGCYWWQASQFDGFSSV